jgi:hypothetical protein
MDAADLVAVVVQQRGDAVGVGGVEDQFLLELALHGGEVGVLAGAVYPRRENGSTEGSRGSRGQISYTNTGAHSLGMRKSASNFDSNG